MKIEKTSQVQIDAAVHKAAKEFTSNNGLVLKVFISKAVAAYMEIKQNAIAG